MALDGCTDLYPSSTLPQHQQCKERCCWLVTAGCGAAAAAQPVCTVGAPRPALAAPLPPSPAAQACQQLPRQPRSPSSRRCIRLNLETWKADPSSGEGNRTSQADAVPPRTFLPPSPHAHPEPPPGGSDSGAGTGHWGSVWHSPAGDEQHRTGTGSITSRLLPTWNTHLQRGTEPQRHELPSPRPRLPPRAGFSHGS